MMNGELPGDWALHNLVYSLSRKRIIINVDLEGFYHHTTLLPDMGGHGSDHTEWIKTFDSTPLLY